MTNKKFKKNPTNFTRMADLISGHPVQKSIAFHFHPCNHLHLPQKKFYVVLWDLLIKFIRTFGGVWQYNVEIRE